jgi:hypothetical protein
MKKSVFLKHLLIIFNFLICYFINIQAQDPTDTTHYVFPEFKLGTVKLKSGKTELAMMDYNKLTEEMIFEKNGVLLALDSIQTIDTVTIESRIFIPHFLPHINNFFELLVKGPVSLFIQHKCIPVAAGNASGYGGTTETGASSNVSYLPNSGRLYKLKLPTDYHVTDATQFWITRNGKYYKANSTAQVIKAFPGKSKEIKQFIKEKNIDIKKIEERVALIVKCNELVR